MNNTDGKNEVFNHWAFSELVLNFQGQISTFFLKIFLFFEYQISRTSFVINIFSFDHSQESLTLSHMALGNDHCACPRSPPIALLLA